MKKFELENGMIVENRLGLKFMVLDDRLINENGWLDLKYIQEDLTYYKRIEGDIIKVWGNYYAGFTEMFHRTKFCPPLWERKVKPMRKMTRKELEDRLGYPILIVPDEEK
jgi:hypothetical protein